MIIRIVTVAHSRLKIPVNMASRAVAFGVTATSAPPASQMPSMIAACLGRTRAARTTAASAVSAIETISQVSPSTPMLLAVANPKTGTTTPTVAYTRQIRCSRRAVARTCASPGSARALRAVGGNMLAATVTGPMATIAAMTWTARRNLVTG